MLVVEPRLLVRRLSETCKQALERAAANAARQHHQEVIVEHLLLALVEEPRSDLQVLLRHFEVDPIALAANLRRSLAELPGGATGRPAFSDDLFEWLQEAWTHASAELGHVILRSGPLLLRLALTPTRFLGLQLPELERLPSARLREELTLASAGSEESVAALRVEAPVMVSDAEAGAGPLERFTEDLTAMAREGRLDPVLGRDKEIRRMTEILLRRRKSNPMIIGEAGVGKTALVEGLALRIASGDVPEQLRSVRLLSVDLGALQAGAGVRGEFENRLKSLVSHAKSSAQPTVLFIDEVHTLIGAGGQQSGDAANLLKPALARGELRAIGATTYAEFKRYIEKDAALERRFQPVHVEEPSRELAHTMLLGVARKFERVHGVPIREEAVRAAVELSDRYISGRHLPDKAVDLLDTAATQARLLRATKPLELQDLEARLAHLRRLHDARLSDRRAGMPVAPQELDSLSSEIRALDDRTVGLRARLEEQRTLLGQLEGVAAPSDPAPDTAAESASLSGPALQALERLRALPPEERLVAAEVDANLVAKVVADWTGIPVGKMVKDHARAVLDLEHTLGARVLGQAAALQAIAKELQAARASLKLPTKPLGAFLLVGPSGVGKTETALALAEALFGGERFMVTINMSEFREAHSASRLIGSPPGYVGFGQGGVLSEAVRHRPYSVVLLDEIEKADIEVVNLFYQVLDKGMLADGEGRVIDFKNTVILMTSNLAAEQIQEAHAAHAALSQSELSALIRPILVRHFKTPLLSRMTVVPYLPMNRDVLRDITLAKLDAVRERARAAHQLRLDVDPAIVEAILDRCQEVDTGARNIEHILQGQVLPVIAELILTALTRAEELVPLRLTLDQHGQIQCERAA